MHLRGSMDLIGQLKQIENYRHIQAANALSATTNY